MRMLQWIWTDLKRLFRHKGAVPAVIVLPLTGLMVFTAVALPLLTSSQSLTVPYAICNEDDSEVVAQFIQLMANSESLKELAIAYPVKDFETAKELLDRGKVCVLVHAPAGFYQEMVRGGEPVVELLAKPEHSFERVMVDLTLKNALANVGGSQALLSNVKTVCIDAGLGEAEAGEMTDAALDRAVQAYMKRRTVLGSTGTVSPLSDYMPVVYYLSALFTLFCALAMLPVIHLTAGDQRSPAIRRGLLCGGGDTLRYFAARLISGAAFVALTLVLLIPVSMLSGKLRVYFGFQSGVKNLLLLMAGIILTALAFSSFSLLAGALTAQPETGLWCGLFSVLLMAFLSGVIAPEERMPPELLAAGLCLPFRPAMNLIADTLFSSNTARCAQDMLRLSGMTTVFGASALLLLERGRRA